MSSGGVLISSAMTSVRGTITSRERLSESSKIERISCGAPLSISRLAACAVSSFSSSSRGGGGDSNRTLPPSGRKATFRVGGGHRPGGEVQQRGDQGEQQHAARDSKQR